MSRPPRVPAPGSVSGTGAPRPPARPPVRPTVRQLEYLLAVSETLHFRRAAEAEGVTQPALSAQIQALEELLGVQLFERTRRKVLPTAAGRQVAARARLVLQAIDELADAARAGASPLSGLLRLGLIPTIAPYLLPQVLPSLRRSFPDLKLYLREEFTEVLLERLAAGELDLLLLALPVEGGEFESLPLFNDDFFLALPPDHPLARKKEVAERDLEGEEVLLLEDGHCLRTQALALCSRAGAREAPRVRATSLGTLTQMVGGGLGMTLLPEIALSVETHSSPNLVVRPFRDPRPTRQVGLVWRRASARGEEFRRFGEELMTAFDAR